ncbi:MAG TPA: zinc ribbon domain-containing protein [Ktedonobacterales bacterium]|jgi:hypothetical protein|nr:zinc ribbon domain-containing protein [Ktedonobacterales bacterium]
MECDRCGARRPRTGRCPNCGAPAPGGSSLSQWKSRGGGGRGSGADWDDYDAPRGRGRQRGDYEEMDLGRALVPSANQIMPMPQGAGLPALPGQPETEEEERALGIRRPAYIPVTSDRPKRKIRSWRVVSGVLSIMLVCIAACGATAFLGKDRLTSVLPPILQTRLTPAVYDFSQVPVTPVSTPGPAAKYVVAAVTSRSVDANLTPIDVTSHFPVGSTVHIIVQIRNVTAGEKHTVTIYWYLNGIDAQVPRGKDRTYQPVTADINVHFGCPYPSAGVGMARIYWDRPDNDTSDQAHDPRLAQTIYFAVEQPTPTPSTKGTPSPSPSGSPTGTQTP